MPKRPLPQLLRERKEVAAQVQASLTRIQALDAEILARYEEVSGVLGLTQPDSVTIPVDSPVHTHHNQIFEGTVTSARGVQAAQAFDLPPAHRRVVLSFGSKSSKYDKAVAEILAEAKMPLPTKIIYNRMLERGVQVDGKVPMNNLSAHLSHSDLFQRTDEGWALKQGELPTQ